MGGTRLTASRQAAKKGATELSAAVASRQTPPTKPRGRVVEDTIGEAVVQAIETFMFRDIEDENECLEIFAFVSDAARRRQLARAFRGVRWLGKVGLVFARPAAHPAHSSQALCQTVLSGGIGELIVWCLLLEDGDTPPAEFAQMIDRCRQRGLLKKEARAAAEQLRLFRNRGHLYLGPVTASAERDARQAYRALNTLINECRTAAGLPAWQFGRSPARS